MLLNFIIYHSSLNTGLLSLAYKHAYISSVSPPAVGVPWGATIIQSPVVKTEIDVMETVKQPQLTVDKGGNTLAMQTPGKLTLTRLTWVIDGNEGNYTQLYFTITAAVIKTSSE